MSILKLFQFDSSIRKPFANLPSCAFSYLGPENKNNLFTFNFNEENYSSVYLMAGGLGFSLKLASSTISSSLEKILRFLEKI